MKPDDRYALKDPIGFELYETQSQRLRLIARDGLVSRQVAGEASDLGAGIGLEGWRGAEYRFEQISQWFLRGWGAPDSDLLQVSGAHDEMGGEATVRS